MTPPPAAATPARPGRYPRYTSSMSKRRDPRDVRRLAMQVLYQIDLTGNADQQAVFETLDEDHDPLEVREEAVALALAAWHDRAEADKVFRDLAPDWPTHRQPPVDRAILRLAHHEIKSGRTHYKIAINEAVELAKEYGSENSSSFVNGVLDKMAKRLPQPTTTQLEPPAASPDAWLKDAMRE